MINNKQPEDGELLAKVLEMYGDRAAICKYVKDVENILI
jgi:hypothetical protein